jgi:endo-1,4-beta-D-glucanase Y
MIPQTVENILDENFYISPCMDNAELEAWLALLPAALQRVCGVAVEKKRGRELAEHEFELINARTYITLDDGINVTTKKMMAKANDGVIAADKTRINTSIGYDAAEVLVKAVEAKSMSVRKIATIRANTQQFSETEYVVKQNQNRQQPVQAPPNFGQPQPGFQQSPVQQQNFQQPQQPQGNNSNYYPPTNQSSV